MNSNQPLVTFLIITYNQENFVSSAIKAAIAQNYSPLEIIISDDCSTDNTWNEIKTSIKVYEGFNEIILNRNHKNLGIARHIDYICRKAKGEFIILAPADDISYSNRTKVLVNAWLNSNPRPSLVHSNCLKIASNDLIIGAKYDLRKLKFYERHKNPFSHSLNISGATTGFERRTYTDFPPIQHDIFAEDAISFHRAHLLNGVTYIPDILLNYRVHDKGTSQSSTRNPKDYIKSFLKFANEQIERTSQYRKDIEFLLVKKDDFIKSISSKEVRAHSLKTLLDNNFLQSTKKLIETLMKSNNREIKKEYLKLYLYRWVMQHIK